MCIKCCSTLTCFISSVEMLFSCLSLLSKAQDFLQRPWFIFHRWLHASHIVCLRSALINVSAAFLLRHFSQALLIIRILHAVVRMAIQKNSSVSHIFPAENRIMKKNQMILFSVDSVLNFLVIADLLIQLLIPVIVDSFLQPVQWHPLSFHIR